MLPVFLSVSACSAVSGGLYGQNARRRWLSQRTNVQRVKDIMAETLDAQEFQQRVLDGTDGYKTLTLEAADGGELDNVEMHPVSKKTLTGAIEAMPDDVFEAVEDEDMDDLSAEEAEEIAEEQGGATVTEDMYEAFEDLCKSSLQHEQATDVQMGIIVDEFAFEVVFELGSEILTYSLENSGQVKGFREQA